MSTATSLRTTARATPLPPNAEGSGEQPIVVSGTSSEAGTGPVVVALDDDGNAGAVLRQARAMAARLGVSLRAAYVWSDCRPPDCPHHRRCHRDLGEASRLLSDLLDQHLAMDESLVVERDIVHDDDPAEALVALSGVASMLVVGRSSHLPVPDGDLGGTTRSLIGRTRCPVVVVPYHQPCATRGLAPRAADARSSSRARAVCRRARASDRVPPAPAAPGGWGSRG